MIRTQIQLTEEQQEMLRGLSAETGWSIADLIRKGIDRLGRIVRGPTGGRWLSGRRGWRGGTRRESRMSAPRMTSTWRRRSSERTAGGRATRCWRDRRSCVGSRLSAFAVGADCGYCQGPLLALAAGDWRRLFGVGDVEQGGLVFGDVDGGGVAVDGAPVEFLKEGRVFAPAGLDLDEEFEEEAAAEEGFEF